MSGVVVPAGHRSARIVVLVASLLSISAVILLVVASGVGRAAVLGALRVVATWRS